MSDSLIPMTIASITAIVNQTKQQIDTNHDVSLTRNLNDIDQQMRKKTFFGLIGPYLTTPDLPTDRQIEDWRPSDYPFSSRYYFTREEYDRVVKRKKTALDNYLKAVSSADPDKDILVSTKDYYLITDSRLYFY